MPRNLKVKDGIKSCTHTSGFIFYFLNKMDKKTEMVSLGLHLKLKKFQNLIKYHFKIISKQYLKI
jgi:hypothetical protein